MMQSISDRQPTGTPHSPFEAEAADVLRELRAALGSVIGHLPRAGQIRKPMDLQRQLALDSKLAWQVHRLAFSDDPLDAGGPQGTGIPKSRSVKRFLDAARKHGVEPRHIDATLTALDKLDALVAFHAGDYGTFESMLSGLSDGGSERIDFAHRKAAFKAQSHLWGVQARTQLWCSLYHPSDTEDDFDSASIRGLRDIRRLRAGTPFRLAGHRLTDAQEHVGALHAVGGDSLRSTQGDGPELLLEFCTQPPPALEHRVQDGYLDTYLKETPLGNAGLQTLYLADLARAVRWRVPGSGPNHLNNNVAVTKPVEALVLDTLIHRDLFGPLAPSVKVMGSLDQIGETDPAKFHPEQMLPVRAEVQRHGSGESPLHTPHVPRYAEIVKHVCCRLGWDIKDFTLYRCAIEYPMLNSVVSVRFPLPDSV